MILRLNVLTLLIILICIAKYNTQFIPPVGSFLKFLQEGGDQIEREPRDTRNLRQRYDFIIVGAGTAGCVLANRLTENPKWKVLLIEAGRTENYLMDVPVMAQYWQLIETDWKYKTQPDQNACLGHTNKQCNWPRGKVMGGSSVLNYMIYTRGNRRDYDGWAQMGNPGWSYKDVLPYFKKIENYKIDEFYNEVYHSHDGHLEVSHPPYRTELAKAFVKAAKEMGYPYVDYNGATQTGVQYLQTSLKNGTRHSSSRAYLHPIANRPNLHVSKNTRVTKIIIDPETKTALGVELYKNQRYQQVFANKEVISSSGAINSPQLLMLSGIGPKQHLSKLNISVISDLKVGYNLQDHYSLGGLTFTVNDTVSLRFDRIISQPYQLLRYFQNHQGMLSIPGGCEALIFRDLNDPKNPDGHPDLEILFVSGAVISDPVLRYTFGISDEVWNEVYAPILQRDAWMAFPMIMLPKSRGRIKLASSNPFDKPLIFANYYGDEYDLNVTVAGTKEIIRLSKMPAMQKFGSKLHEIPMPGCKQLTFGTDDYWRCHARQLTFTIYHHTSTCKMGPDSDKNAVVTPRLLVRGVKNLRVVDASIMPKIPSAHTNSPTYMIAEKAADMIKEDHGFRTNTKI